MADFQTFNVRDALLKRDAVIADDAVTESLDLGELTERGSRLEDYEIGIFAEEAPNAAFPAGTGAEFSLEFSDDLEFTDPDIFSCNRWTQAGSVAGTKSLEAFFRTPTKCPRYVRVKAATSGETQVTTARFGLEIFG